MNRSLDGQHVLVTGGSGGIGRACVERFRIEGATVYSADIKAGSSDEIELDVTDPAQWAAVIAALPPLDVVMLNAGIITPERATLDSGAVPLTDVTDQAYRAIIGVNLDGVFFGARAALPTMVERGVGHLLVTASVAGLAGLPGDAAYTATKHAVVGLVRSLGISLEPLGVCVSALCPGFVDTPLLPADVQAVILEMGLPIIAPSRVAEAAMQALTERVNGSQWVVWGNTIKLHPQPELSDL